MSTEEAPDPCENGTCDCNGHPAPDDEEELVHLEMGMRPFTEEAHCPKCMFSSVKSEWHVMAIAGHTPRYPCDDWIFRGLLTGSVGEHLCRTCHRCGYGWPEQCADS
jgi:hypothetical protein